MPRVIPNFLSKAYYEEQEADAQPLRFGYYITLHRNTGKLDRVFYAVPNSEVYVETTPGTPPSVVEFLTWATGKILSTIPPEILHFFLNAHQVCWSGIVPTVVLVDYNKDRIYITARKVTWTFKLSEWLEDAS